MSDVVLLPCRIKLQLHSAKALQKPNFDSDVVPESFQLQGVLNRVKNLTVKRSPIK